MKGDSILKEIQIQNFRSLKDTGLQKLSPITVLVGENSSGKSTFLRSFPLLKQSISKRTSGPILWAGDVDDYVDFGSFRESVTNDESEEIKFRYKFDIRGAGIYYRYFSIKDPFTDERIDFPVDNIDYTIAIKSKQGKDYVSSCKIKLNSYCVDFDLESQNVYVDNRIIYSKEKLDKKNKDTIDNRTYNSYFMPFSHVFGFFFPNINSLWQDLVKEIGIDPAEQTYSHSILKEAVIDIGCLLDMYPQIPIIPLSESDEDSLKFRKTIYNRLVTTLNSQNSDRILRIVKLLYVYGIMDDIDEYIFSYFKNVHYIAPLRATAERYYRFRNLAVDEVDYQGKNLAVFINSLPQNRLTSFQEWTNSYFGFSVNTDKSAGHLSLQIKLQNSNKYINLSDTGFGYSQILPIITQIWELSSRKNAQVRMRRPQYSKVPLVIAIEQPELHLHPAVQAKLANAFIACIALAQKNKQELQIILETHSETIINYFGRAIARNKLKEDDVSLILFERDFNHGITKVCNSYYDSDGFLVNWPYGFFDAGE